MIDGSLRPEATDQRTTLPDTARILEELLRAGRFPVSQSILSMVPPNPGIRSWDRVEGMLLGLAIGDSLGNTSESQVPAAAARAPVLGIHGVGAPRTHCGNQVPQSDSVARGEQS
jgi:hypothetical protein